MAASVNIDTVAKCIKCLQIIKSEEKIFKCSSFCVNKIHQSCTIYKPTEIRVIEKNSNITWSCDACVANVENVLESKLETFSLLLNNCVSEIMQLKQCIEVQNKNIESLTVQNCLRNNEIAATSSIAKMDNQNIGKVDLQPLVAISDAMITNNENEYNNTENITGVQMTPTYSAITQTKLNKVLSVPKTTLIKKSAPVCVETDNKKQGEVNGHSSGIIQTEDLPLTNEDGFIEQKNRRKKRINPSYANIVGSNKTESNFLSAPKRAWYFLGRVNPNTEINAIVTFLRNLISNDDIFCEVIKTESRNSCFKIGVDFKFKDKIEDPKSWPAGVVVRRYIFRKPASSSTNK